MTGLHRTRTAARRAILLAMGLVLAASPAAAEVKAASEGGFSIAMTTVVAAPPDRLWAAMTQIGRWWNPDHSWSGDAANMTLDARAGGCFCEALPREKGSVEHLRVLFAQPGALLRLGGGLGPLQTMAINGVMDWKLKPVASGTELSLTYAVSGAIPGGGQGLAPIVDQVLAEQFGRLKAFAEKK